MPSSTHAPATQPAHPFTPRAVAVGVLSSCVLGATIVIAGLKAGITPGVSPLVILIGWAVFARAVRDPGGSGLLNHVQVAGSAGAAVAAGVIFTAPLLPILSAAQGLPYDGLPLIKLCAAAFIGALIGFGYVGLNARKVLSDASLPAPEARASEALIRVATGAYDARTSTDGAHTSANPTQTGSADDGSARDASSSPDRVALDTAKPNIRRSLIPGVLLGIGAPLLSTMSLVSSQLPLFIRSIESTGRSVQIHLPFAPIYFGIGGLLGVGTALAAFAGTLVRVSGEVTLTIAALNAQHWPDTSLRWIGGGAMTVAVLWSMARMLGVVSSTGGRSAPPTANPHTLQVPKATRRRLWANIGVGAILLIAGTIALGGLSVFSISLALTVTVCAAFIVALGALLSLQIGSSASPVSGTVFLMTLILCAVALAFGRGGSAADLELMTLSLVAACVAVCAANDSSQDYRTLQLCGMPIERGFGGQWLGLVTGAIVVPVTLVLAERAFGLGTAALPAPQGQLFATLVEGMLFERQLPWRPIAVGAAIGGVAVLLEQRGRARGWQLPAMALAVGLYLPPELGVGLILGSLARYLGDRGGVERSESVLAAGGLITGAAVFDIALGVALLMGVSTASLQVAGVPAWTQHLLAVVGIAMVLALLYTRARGPKRA